MSPSFEYEIVKPTSLPYPETLVIKCPRCDARLEYVAYEDDRNTFGAFEEWPVCDDCKILIDVSYVAIVDRGKPYFVQEH